MGIFDHPIEIKILNNKVALDQECWACDCCSKEPEWKDSDGNCDYCHGDGFQLTDAGRAIIDLVNRHTKKTIWRKERP